MEKLDARRMAAAIALASVPESIRGYGPIKHRSMVQARAKQMELLANFASESD